MKLGFSKKIWLFLIGSFAYGLGQAFMMLFLNFYLKSLGLDDSHTGLVNALPAFTSAALSIPAVLLSRRFGEVRTMKLGTIIGLSGILCITFANGPLVALVGSFLQGIGSAFIMVATSPFMAKESTPSNRVTLFSIQMALSTGAGFLGNLIGGSVPQWYGHFTGSGVDSVPALRTALIVATVFQLMGLFSVLLIENDEEIVHTPGQKRPGFQVENKRFMFFLVASGMPVGIGAGLTIPYLNIFIEGKFGIDFQTLGSLFGWTSLATAATVLIQPYLVRRLGHLRTGLMVEIASLPFLALLGFSSHLWLVIIAMFTRGALMNATGPAYNTYAMEHLSKEDRPVYSALGMISWSTTWAIAASVSGFFRQMMGPARQQEAFQYLFAGTLIMYALSMLMRYVLLYLPYKRQMVHTLEESSWTN